MAELSPLDAGLIQIGQNVSGLQFPPSGWVIIQPWGFGYALRSASGLRAIIDCSLKDDDQWWVHVSISRVSRTPSHEDMAEAKRAFLGNRYAYAVYPPQEEYVNIHQHCLHLWALVDAGNGRVLPEFSSVLDGIGKSI